MPTLLVGMSKPNMKFSGGFCEWNSLRKTSQIGQSDPELWPGEVPTTESILGSTRSFPIFKPSYLSDLYQKLPLFSFFRKNGLWNLTKYKYY